TRVPKSLLRCVVIAAAAAALLVLQAPAGAGPPGHLKIALGAARKFVTFPRVHIEAVVEPDGSMLVTESRAYRFHGPYSWWEQWIPHGGDYQVTILDVGEPGHGYESADTAGPGTYRVRQGADHTEVRWHFEAQDEERTFVI